MAKIKTCIVYRCANTSDRGAFVGNLCVPCYSFITNIEGRHSQIYRNAIGVALKDKLESPETKDVKIEMVVPTEHVQTILSPGNHTLEVCLLRCESCREGNHSSCSGLLSYKTKNYRCPCTCNLNRPL